ncbi:MULTISPECIES: hypothetical protein [unclassified Moorena]|uniref:hypothetical protein n=1 Tax=unclassified Moorena TaxID=2683338 RepID=UPI0013FF4934|nr:MULTISPECIES: hypothetical protein [unclassified Moorena]NEO17775.1 hypothetical protein [Moorena sp. SIO3E8]NEQ04332.1 hypothetical protein [Moorena sp. SIO3F7]
MKSFLERASGCGVGIWASGCGTGILPVSFPGGQDAHSTYIDSLPLILCSLFPIPCSRLLKEVNSPIFVIPIKIRLVLLLPLFFVLCSLF